jgi:hypothetical protein
MAILDPRTLDQIEAETTALVAKIAGLETEREQVEATVYAISTLLVEQSDETAERVFKAVRACLEGFRTHQALEAATSGGGPSS